eukprot:11218388-Lingulodinium_polyedra.AAC.1
MEFFTHALNIACPQTLPTRPTRNGWQIARPRAHCARQKTGARVERASVRFANKAAADGRCGRIVAQ